MHTSLFDTLLVAVGFSALTTFFVPNFHVERYHSPVRICHSNQKRIAGAIEMFNLDYGVNLEGLTPRIRRSLVEHGYLQRFPRDPVPRDREDDPTVVRGEYVMTDMTGNGVACTLHGGIRPWPRDEPWEREDTERLVARRTGLSRSMVRHLHEELGKEKSPPPPPTSWF